MRTGLVCWMAAALTIGGLACTDDSPSSDVSDADVASDPDGESGVDDVGEEVARATMVLSSLTPAAQPQAGSAYPVSFLVRDRSGAGVAEVELSVSVTAGAGTIEGSDTWVGSTTNDGWVEAPWVLGAAPVRQEITATVRDLEASFFAIGAVDETIAPEELVDLDAYLTGEGIEGSTEDLAFSNDGELYMGVPGGFVVIDAEGEIRSLALSGDDVGRPLGIAFDADGNLWAADADRLALLRVTPEGEVSTALTTNGEVDLVGPNYVAVGREGEVFLTDPCLGEVIVYDPEGERVVTTYAFDVPSQGGPNGVALDESGEWLYVATENPAIFCTIPGLQIDTPVGGVYRIALSGDDAGAVEAVVEGVALFGDGLAFDAEGNLWVVFTNNEGLALGESGVWILPRGATALQPYISLDDAIVANVAFGVAPFDERTLYMAMLAVNPFTREETRGLRALEVGLEGLPLR